MGTLKKCECKCGAPAKKCVQAKLSNLEVFVEEVSRPA